MHILTFAVLFIAGAATVAGAPTRRQESTPGVAARQDSPVVLFELDPIIARIAGQGTTVAGREVSIRELRVVDVDGTGFWVTGARGDGRVFVLPAEGELIEVTPGDTVNVRGDVRVTAEHWRRTGTGSGVDSDVFIYAYTVRPARAVQP